MVGKPNGTFVVWGPSKNPEIYALSAVLNNKVTHHKLTVPKDGPPQIGTVELTGNGLDDAVDALKEKVSGCAVLLTEFATKLHPTVMSRMIEQPLGLTLEHKDDAVPPGVFVKRVKENSNSAKAEGIEDGMRIIGVNGVDVSSFVDKSQVSEIIKKNPGLPITVTFVLL